MKEPLIEGLSSAEWSGLLAETLEWVSRRLVSTFPGSTDGEDIGGEVGQRLLRYRRSAMTRSAFRAVAWKIASNCRVDRYRAVQRAEQYAKKEVSAHVEDRSRGSAQSVEQSDHLKSVLLDILSTIPREMRLLLWMRFMDGASYEQIATTQDSSETTVRRRIKESLNRLDAALRSRQIDDRILHEALRSIGVKL